MNPRLAWGCYLSAVFTGFAALETRAVQLRNRGANPSPTLTTTLRGWLGISPRHSRRHVLGPLFVGLLVWLYGHIVHGWKP